MSSIFTKIVQGQIPCYKIDESENELAFLDVMPLVEGHTLVIPKKEVDFIFDIDTSAYQELWGFAQQVAKKLQKAYPDKRIAVAVVGLEVPHAHIHLLPIHQVKEMNFSNERLKFSTEEYQNIINKISRA